MYINKSAMYVPSQPLIIMEVQCQRQPPCQIICRHRTKVIKGLEVLSLKICNLVFLIHNMLRDFDMFGFSKRALHQNKKKLLVFFKIAEISDSVGITLAPDSDMLDWLQEVDVVADHTEGRCRAEHSSQGPIL
jgi:hypothetical protein